MSIYFYEYLPHLFIYQAEYFLQVPHVDILERVSAILKDFGFCPTAEGFDIGNMYYLALLNDN